MPNSYATQTGIKGMADYFVSRFSDLDSAYQSTLVMHPDQKGEPLSIHPNAVDNWVDSDSKSNDSFLQWLVAAYAQLVTKNQLPQNVVSSRNQKPVTLDSTRPGTVQTPGNVSRYHVREWIKNPTEYAKEIKTYPWTMATAYAFDLGTLDTLLGQRILAIQDYNRKHPKDTTFFEALKPVTDVLKEIAPVVQLVVSFVPGIGTIASMAIGATAAALEGKSLTEIAQATALGAVPGGPLVVAGAAAAINSAKAAVRGKNVLKEAGASLANSALQYIPVQDRPAAQKAIAAVESGKNVLTATEQASLDLAISQISDPNAQQLARDAVSGHLNPKTVLAALVSSQLPAISFTDSLTTAAKDVLSNIQIPNASSLLKNARDEIIAAASNFVTDANARKVLGDATSAILSSCSDSTIDHRPSTIESQALTTIKDPAALKIFQTVLSGQCSPQSVFAATDGLLIQVMVKSDLDSNLAKLLIADKAPAPKLSAKGAVLSGGIQAGTLASVDGRGSRVEKKGSFMQLPGTGTPNEQFQPDGSTQWTVGFWIQVA